MAKFIGTAGHDGHGKTTLIRALTGNTADRSSEDTERGTTIDGGDAVVDLPDLGRATLFDAPSSQRFLTDMLVRSLGIDAALLCVAADAGVVPQTREHLRILEILPIPSLVVALTRCDVIDADARSKALEAAASLIGRTRFGSAPIVFTSATTGEGVEDLRIELAKALRTEGGERNEDAPWYMPVESTFDVKGQGCVATGTIAQGLVRVGDRAILIPGGLEARVRTIHCHGESAQSSEAGVRTTLNLEGVEADELGRVWSLGAPGALFETSVLDARVRWVGPRRQGQQVRVSIGAEEAVAKMFLSDQDREHVQLRFEMPIACAKEQPLILRRYSPPDLIAGGRVVVPLGVIRRRSEPVAIVRARSDREGILQVVGDDPNGVGTDEICRLLGKTPQALGTTFENMLEDEALLGFAGLWMTPKAFETGYRRFAETLGTMHREKPAQAGLPREAVVHRAGLNWAGKPLDRILSRLSSENRVVVNGTKVRSAGFLLQLSLRQRELLDRVMSAMEKESVNVPYPQDLARAIPVPTQAVEEILRLGMQAGEIVNVAEGIYYTRRQIDAIKARIAEIAGAKPFSAAAMRDALGTTRKYIIPLLEHLDAVRFTTRVGDDRVVVRRSASERHR